MADMKTWFLATRPWSFSMSAISVTIGSVWATEGVFSFGRYFLTLLGMVALHGATNLLNDYYDVKNQVDMPSGSSYGGFQGLDRRFRSLRDRAHLFFQFHASGCGRCCRPVLGVHVLAIGNPMARGDFPRSLDLLRFRGGSHTLTHFFPTAIESHDVS